MGKNPGLNGAITLSRSWLASLQESSTTLTDFQAGRGAIPSPLWTSRPSFEEHSVGKGSFSDGQDFD